MSHETIYVILLVIISFDFVLERTLHYLNRKSSKQPIPKELDGIYDQEKYKKSQAYQRTLSRFGTLTAIITFVLTFLAIGLGWFGYMDEWVRSFAPNILVASLYFFVILYFISDILGLPFSIYRTFVIEEKFGFNKTTIKTFILDKLKGYLLTLIIGGLLLGAFIYLVHAVGSTFWIYFWGILILFSLFANFFYTTLLLPLFNKLTPLQEGELKTSIQEYGSKVGFPLKNIFIIDGSKRSSKGNAFFSGFGRKKKVVLYDTLVEKHEVDELTAVFAHEVGHYKKKHIIISTVLSIATMGIMLYLLSLMIQNSQVSFAMGGQITAIHLNMLAFGILYSPLSHVLGILGNLLSRKFEYQADAYATETFGSGPLITALKKMSADHLTNLTPHPAFVFVHYSHPPLLSRVQAMKSHE